MNTATEHTYEMETVREIWPPTGSERYEIGPDRDGLGLVEIRVRESGGGISARMTFEPELAKLVATAMLKCCNEITD